MLSFLEPCHAIQLPCQMLCSFDSRLFFMMDKHVYLGSEELYSFFRPDYDLLVNRFIFNQQDVDPASFSLNLDATSILADELNAQDCVFLVIKLQF